MKIKGIRKRAKGFISLLLILSVMFGLLVPFDITAFADAPATGSNIHALLYQDTKGKYTLVFQNDTEQDSSYGTFVAPYDDFADRAYGESTKASPWSGYAGILPKLCSGIKFNRKTHQDGLVTQALLVTPTLYL